MNVEMMAVKDIFKLIIDRFGTDRSKVDNAENR